VLIFLMADYFKEFWTTTCPIGAEFTAISKLLECLTSQKISIFLIYCVKKN